MIYKKYALCALAFAVISCKKNAQSIPVKNVDVYVGGSLSINTNSKAIYWKNNSPVGLGDTTVYNSITSITVDGNDLYAAGLMKVGGSGFASVGYWKNGVFTPLSNPAHQYQNVVIAVSKGNVYVAANDISGALKTITVWKNGTSLDLSTAPAQNNAIAVNGDDVYIAGNVNNQATYWKNGVATKLNDGSLYSDARAIAVHGIDLYIASNTNIYGGDAEYWKNDMLTKLGKGSANSICINGNDVYVAGYSVAANGNYVATYWKNGNKVTLTDGSESAEAQGMAINGSDVYVAGTVGLFAAYWKNGKITQLSNRESNVAGIALITR